MHTNTVAVTDALILIDRELSSVAARLAGDIDTAAQLSALTESVANADRVFLVGAGRSGLALRMTAMRLMHLGLSVHVVGDVTTPAIRSGDVLLTASGSGTTGGIVRAAQSAVNAGASVAAITTAASSPLAALAATLVVVPAAGKLDRSGSASSQYSGSLFEQLVVVIGDALFHTLWQRGGSSADELWSLHANLE
ncbi:3-hexulose-6-phosphate isomerase [Leifsonia sp. Root4]|uniref:6-phospho-3-hexuloisomerase n=1 Tax=Leifsonia sp. Root4 TaxID=1736525 RepID=UPI0007009446|nr:6-phospho-3-hexuloisomerase [Leifsonia sp. Root4]KQW05639.1 3-hexulose-6-phosphate isomerase [Leifsonia sp. Root4]